MEYCLRGSDDYVLIKNAYQQILDPLPTTAKQLNPSRPCFISGHSLGTALATLAAINIALTVPQLRSQLQLYTYASLRVGDSTFAEAHSRLIPNNYRVVNLADVITLVPPTKLNDIYMHIGQGAFLSQVAEVAASSAASDLGDKKRAYRRNGVKEYIVWQVFDQKIDWYHLTEEDYIPLEANENGVICSSVFPGLWLDVATMLTGDMPKVLAVLQQGLASDDHQQFVEQLASQRER